MMQVLPRLSLRIAPQDKMVAPFNPMDRSEFIAG